MVDMEVSVEEIALATRKEVEKAIALIDQRFLMEEAIAPILLKVLVLIFQLLSSGNQSSSNTNSKE